MRDYYQVENLVSIFLTSRMWVLLI